jgi:hypothetical protein
VCDLSEVLITRAACVGIRSFGGSNRELVTESQLAWRGSGSALQRSGVWSACRQQRRHGDENEIHSSFHDVCLSISVWRRGPSKWQWSNGDQHEEELNHLL